MHLIRASRLLSHLSAFPNSRSYIGTASAFSSCTGSSGWTPDDMEQIAQNLSKLERREIRASPAVRRAAVLLPLCNNDGVASILFTKRSEHVGSHKGHVSFPGGMQDPEDKDFIDTALRETEEEIGVSRSSIRVLGLFHDAYSITRVPVTPVIAFLPDLDLAKLKISEREIDSVFTITLADLLDPTKVATDEQSSRRHGVPLKVFSAGPAPVWGLTAFVLNEALQSVLRTDSKWKSM